MQTINSLPFTEASRHANNVALGSNPDHSCRGVEQIPHLRLVTAANYSPIDLSLPKMALRGLYSREANSHRNMLRRQKSKGARVAPEFQDFASFLCHVGPMPAPGCTLDRIDNTDPEYAPGKVRCADKPTQNSNKGDTLVFRCSRTAETYTTSRLAEKHNVSASTIRKQRERQWSDDEIIEGKRSADCSAALTTPVGKKPPRYVSPPPIPYAEQCRLIRREEARDYIDHCRENHGDEGIPTTPDEIAEILGDDAVLNDKDWRRAAWKNYINFILPGFIREHGDFIQFDKVHPRYHDALAQAVPAWVEKQLAAKAIQKAVTEKL